jgi:hypothetical protein
VLDVPGTLALSGLWEDGTFQGPAGGRILTNAAFEIAEGTVGKQLFGGVVLDIAGTTNWFGGDIVMDGGATIEVHDAGALVLGDGAGSTASLRVGGGGGGQLRLVNGGALVLQSAMGGVSRIDAGLFADGLVRVQMGTLELAGGSDLQRRTHVAAGMTLRFVSGLNQLRNGADFTGHGLTVIDGGVLQVGGGDVAGIATSLRLAGGELANDGQLDVHGGVVLAGGRINGAGTNTLYTGLVFESGELLGTGQTIVRGGELRFDTAADKDIGGGHVLTFDPGPGLDWKLANVVFDDGGTATGQFHFDSATGTVTSWGVQTTGGDLQTFPETLYANGLPGHSGISGFTPQAVQLGQPGIDMRDRQLRLQPLTALGDMEATIPISLVGGFGHEECFNCAPARTMVSGELVGLRPTANWLDGVVRLSNGSRLEIASSNLEIATPAGIDLQTGAGGGFLEIGTAGNVAIVGTGNRAIAAGLDLAGELIVNNGTLLLAGGGNVRGVLGADTGAQLDLTTVGSTLLLQDGAQLGARAGAVTRIGAGTLAVAPGETARALFDGILIDGRLELGAGSVLRAELAMAAPSRLDIGAGAQIVGNGTVAVDGMSTLAIDGDFLLDGATLQNGGAATWRGSPTAPRSATRARCRSTAWHVRMPCRRRVVRCRTLRAACSTSARASSCSSTPRSRTWASCSSWTPSCCWARRMRCSQAATCSTRRPPARTSWCSRAWRAWAPHRCRR